MTVRVRGRTRVCLLGVAALVTVLALPPAAAWAHGEMEEEPGNEETQHVASEDRHGSREATELELRLPEEARLGDHVRLETVLMEHGEHGDEALGGVPVTFEAPAVWGEEIQGPMVLGTATTDEDGTAWIEIEVRTSDEVEVTASFYGDEEHRPSAASGELMVEGTKQLYAPTVGLRVPWLNLWVLAAAIALVWGLYLVAGSRILAIARAPAARGEAEPTRPATTRRDFLRRALPYGAVAGVAALGAGLVGIVARSPRTHGNLMAPPATQRYARTPVAFVGQRLEMREMPPPLDREVSFSREVLPIFLQNAGPHVVMPEHSPPPGGVMLDTYNHVMAMDGVVVPGHPEESELVEHLLSPAMQMPPSVPPLPGEQIQLVVTWIAQGAKDN